MIAPDSLARFGAWFLELSLQGTVVAIVVLLLVRLLRRSSPTLRHALLVLALVKFALPPTWTLPTGLLSRFDLPHLHSYSPGAEDPPAIVVKAARNPSTDRIPATQEVVPALETPSSNASFRGPQTAVTPPPNPLRPDDELRAAPAGATQRIARSIPITSILLVSYALFALGWIVKSVRTEREHRRAWLRASSPSRAMAANFERILERLRVSRPIELRIGDATSGAFAFGVLKRRVVLPSSLESLPRAQLDAILAHEVMHHVRGDLIIAWFAEVLRWAHPLNPALWLLLAELRRTREECCDDAVLASGVASPTAYGEALVTAASLHGVARLAHGVSMSEHPVATRLRRLFDPRITRQSRLGVREWGAAFAAAIVLLPGTRAAVIESGERIAAAPGTEAPQHEIVGRVTTQSGLPVEGARIYLSAYDQFGDTRASNALRAITDRSGEYRFTALDVDLWRDYNARLIARAPEHGFAFATARLDRNDFVLPDADAPLSGTIVDTEGQPVVGARVRLRQVFRQTDSSYGEFVEALRESRLPANTPHGVLDAAEWSGVAFEATSDSSGHVSIRGISPDALVTLEVEAPGRVRALARVLARDMAPILYPQHPEPNLGAILFQGRAFEVVLSRSLVVRGQVRDRVTGAPIRNANVVFEWFLPGSVYESTAIEVLESLRAVTDEDGRYCLDGLPPEFGVKLRAEPPSDDRRYLLHTEALPVGLGSEARLDFALEPAFQRRFQFVDHATQRPIAGVALRDLPNFDDPRKARFPDLGGDYILPTRSDANGELRFAVVPGDGRWVVDPPAPYRTRPTLEEHSDRLWIDGVDSDPRFHIEETDSSSVAIQTIELFRSGDVPCRIVDSNGQPVTGARIYGQIENTGWSEPLASDRTSLIGFDPQNPRVVFADLREQDLSGYLVPDPNASEQVIHLVENAKVIGRLVDEFGHPRAHVALQIRTTLLGPTGTQEWVHPQVFYNPWRILTDDAGRFEMRALRPGAMYMLIERRKDSEAESPFIGIFDPFEVAPGEIYEMGDLHVVEQ